MAIRAPDGANKLTLQSQNSNCLKLGNNFRANIWLNIFCSENDDFRYFLYDQYYLDNEEVFLT